MATRTMSMREWRRSKMERSDPGCRMDCAYDWLRAALKDLAKRRDPDPAERERFRQLRVQLLRAAAAHLNVQRRVMDETIRADVRDLQRRHTLRKALEAARTDEDRMRFASDWFRSSAKRLASRRHVQQHLENLALRDRLMAESAEFMAGLAEIAEGDRA